eukprot:m.310700 g.310700  ORF g.310700 m.310700 type:complete len:577 (+) comp53937_c0_seq1:323-2053(+)
MYTAATSFSVFLFFAACGLTATGSITSRKYAILHDVGSVKPTRAKRTSVPTSRRVDDGRRGTTHFHVMNAFAHSEPVSLRLPGKSFDDMQYGDVRVANIDTSLSMADSYRVSSGNDSYVAKVSKSVEGIPLNSDVFIIADMEADDSLRDMFSVWDRNNKIPDDHFWLLSYNAFSHSGLDVLIFDPRKVGSDDYSLQRIGMNIESFDAYYVQLPVSDYELKVVPHDTVKDIDDFKNAYSLTPPMFISPKKGARYYGAIVGIFGNYDKYKPDYQTAPPLPDATPFHTPLTRVIIINAYSQKSSVEVDFKGEHLFRPLKYGKTAAGHFHLIKHDRYRIKSTRLDDSEGGRDSSWQSGQVNTIVPYENSECVLIPDTGKKENLESFLHCWGSNDLDVRQDQVFFFTYHALTNFTDLVDVVFFDRSISDPDKHSLLAIADHLVLGRGVRAHVPVPKTLYEVKVVKSGTVRTSDDFDSARSLLPPLTIQPIGGHRYYAVLSGIAKSAEFKPEVIFYPGIKKNLPPPQGPPETVHPTTHIQRVDATVDASWTPSGTEGFSKAVSHGFHLHFVVALVALLLLWQ